MHARVEATADEICVGEAPVPDFDEYATDYHAGVPLIHSWTLTVDLLPPESEVLALIKTLASSSLPSTFVDQCRALQSEIDSIGARNELPLTHIGLFRYLGWAVLVRYLAPVVSAFDAWRNEERWLRNYCPTCGEPPAMAQLIGQDPGRLRKLACGRCKTRWRYRQTGCPFCDVQDEHRLSVVAVEGEGLRIDYCERCDGYLKTYDGEGSESILLADWTSLHLDIIARERGLKRMAASLYTLGA